MGIEAAQFIAQLVSTNPLDSDARSSASSHIQLIKQALLNTFAKVGAAISASSADFSMLAGLGLLPGGVLHMPAGTVALFVQAAAPTGWTQVVTWNDTILRVVNDGTGSSIGGSWTISGVTAADAGHPLAVSELPVHSHTANSIATTGTVQGGGSLTMVSGTSNTVSVGAGNAHTHTITIAADGTWRPAYVNVIACSKN